MMRRLVFLFGTLLLLWGCGYHLPGQGGTLPPEIETLHIELFSNRTSEPFLENQVTDFVTDQFARRRMLRLVEDPAQADAVLTGSVTAYSAVPVSYDRNDRITEYRSTMEISATLRRADVGEVLWKGNVSWTEEYPASLDKMAQEDEEAAAIEVISERLAEELYFRITENF
jgi:outer membrane lipopolysaccharide assembly protein LptE/RlpB